MKSPPYQDLTKTANQVFGPNPRPQKVSTN